MGRRWERFQSALIGPPLVVGRGGLDEVEQEKARAAKLQEILFKESCLCCMKRDVPKMSAKAIVCNPCYELCVREKVSPGAGSGLATRHLVWQHQFVSDEDFEAYRANLLRDMEIQERKIGIARPDPKGTTGKGAS